MPKTSQKSLKITLKKHPSYNELQEQLIDLGYERVNLVMSSGDVAVRGSIIDIFPMNLPDPVRIEYYEDEIDRLVKFSVHDQRQTEPLKSVEIQPIDPEQVEIIHRHQDMVDTQLLSSIQVGDYVVHELYGIGQFMELSHMKFGTREGDYLYIQYKGNDKLFVPMDQLHLVHKYSGADLVPKINGLNDSAWKKTKKKSIRALQEWVSEIYERMRHRQTAKGMCFDNPSEALLDFESKFPYPLTKDQVKAWKDIQGDMASPKPMDRLLCADVGFGKTEMMMRASFLAVDHLKQVMILVPSTVLAKQQFQRFEERFEGTGYRIAMLSRLHSPQENKKALKDLKDHKIDIVIGTHRLLQKDVEFADLGFVAVDEEQRFGVGHKERIKAISKNVDILSSTATPIPRTLYLSLSGSKSFSFIQTPPPGRRPIHTQVSAYDDKLLKTAMNRELKRKGQIYYLFNSIRWMDDKASRIKRLFPDVRIGKMHGQLPANQLDETMQKFEDGELDVLLSTTMIENGLDIAAANTIIIDKAEHLGLSQLHQLRGRVGRSDLQAYCVVFHSPNCTDDAKKRLQAIQEYVAIGAGYQLAMRDLEIRGAGTVLGEKQHGHMTAIGFDLYCKLLDQMVNPQKIREEWPSDLALYISPEYIEDPRLRLACYRQISQARDAIDLDLAIEELKDRFGELPKDLMTSYRKRKAQLQDANEDASKYL